MDFFIKHIIVWQNWTTNWLKSHWKMTRNKLIYFFINFIVRLSSVLRGFHPCHNSQWPPTMISIPDFIQYIFCPIFILEKEPVFHFLMLSAKQLPGTIFITSLVWRGPWLWIEPLTSRTQCQHSTTRLSRRWFLFVESCIQIILWKCI